MTKVHRGERITKGAKLRIGSSAVIFNVDRTKILLTRRNDNGDWCIPGGALESGESVAETCAREVWEETGLRVEVIRLAGVYSNRDLLIEYPDGTRVQIIVLNFEARIIGGSMALSNETTDIGFFSLDEIEDMKLLGNHRERIADTIASQNSTIVR